MEFFLPGKKTLWWRHCLPGRTYSCWAKIHNSPTLAVVFSLVACFRHRYRMMPSSLLVAPLTLHVFFSANHSHHHNYCSIWSVKFSNYYWKIISELQSRYKTAQGPKPSRIAYIFCRLSHMDLSKLLLLQLGTRYLSRDLWIRAEYLLRTFRSWNVTQYNFFAMREGISRCTTFFFLIKDQLLSQDAQPSQILLQINGYRIICVFWQLCEGVGHQLSACSWMQLTLYIHFRRLPQQ